MRQLIAQRLRAATVFLSAAKDLNNARFFAALRMTCAVVIGCGLVLAACATAVRGEGFFGECEMMWGPESAADVDAPPAYAASPAANGVAEFARIQPDHDQTKSELLRVQLQRAVASSSAPAVLPAARSAAPVGAWSSAEPRLTGQARQAIEYYGGASAAATPGQIPRPPQVISSEPSTSRRAQKPFQTVAQDPTVSPYLNLYREETGADALPNYFAFVRPQLEQIESNREQMRELQQLRRQVQGGWPAVTGPQYRSAGPPATSRVGHFMDTAQFYGQWQR